MSGKLVDTTLLHYFRTKLDTVFAKKSEVGDKNVIEHVQKNGTELTVTNKTVNVTVPTRTSELTNDSGFVTGDSIPTKTSQLTNDSGYITSDDIPTKTSQLTNDSNFVSDANYVHTDNNFTSQDKTKLESVEQGAQVNVIEKVQQNGVDLNIENKTVNVTVPTKTSELENDSDFVTSADIPEGGIVDTELSSTSTNPVQNKAIKQETDKILGNLATIETSPAIANHAVGSYIVYNSQLYRVTSAITAGGTLEGRIQATNVMDETVKVKYVTIPLTNTNIPANSGASVLNWGGVGPSYLPGKTIVGAFLAFASGSTLYQTNCQVNSSTGGVYLSVYNPSSRTITVSSILLAVLYTG